MILDLDKARWRKQRKALEFGDSPGHPFHGNQWTGGLAEMIQRLNDVEKGLVDPAPHNTERNQTFLQNQLIRAMGDWRAGKMDLPAVRKIAEEAAKHPNPEVAGIAKALLQATHEFSVQEFGDLPGHEFRGNQWTGGRGGQFLESMKNPDTLAQEIKDSPDDFQPTGPGGGISDSMWYVMENGDHYLVKTGAAGEGLSELMSQTILDKTDIPHMAVRRAGEMDDSGNSTVVIQHLDQNPEAVPGSFKLGPNPPFDDKGDLSSGMSDEQLTSWTKDNMTAEIFDELTVNLDRHGGNIGTVEDPETGLTRLALIDNSLTMGSGIYSQAHMTDVPDYPFSASISTQMSVGDLVDQVGLEKAHVIVEEHFTSAVEGLRAGVDATRTAAARESYGVRDTPTSRYAAGPVAGAPAHTSQEAYENRVKILQDRMTWIENSHDEYVRTAFLGTETPRFELTPSMKALGVMIASAQPLVMEME